MFRYWSRTLLLAFFQVREARPYYCNSIFYRFYCCAAILWLVCHCESMKCLGMLYGIVGVTVAGKQWRETRVLTQARLVETGQIHTRALTQAESSRLSEASRSSEASCLGERGLPKRVRVRTLARCCSF